MDWNLIVVAVITGLAGLLGAVGGAGVSGYYARRSARESQIRQIYIEERRDLHLLYREVLDVDSYPRLRPEQLEQKKRHLRELIGRLSMGAFSGEISVLYGKLNSQFSDIVNMVKSGKITHSDGSLVSEVEKRLEHIFDRIIEIEKAYDEIILAPRIKDPTA